ncbi:4-hydroxy-tetrahydrodipicolinate reductase [Fructobacillus fructosus]|uniref:4-hydroxy-tetrahydrodipicolinate reductase n=1 Tax=Fructobacillus fructosus TaxID=1631 RepID=UPI002DA0B30E|nr:4-hydroxy-tetrahydrodipicolinate reductase (DapB) [Fructobacillus fructosus]CAK1228567.1 4-hydroxy-tetrahydrodipicolinate reductase (DapB) [Fructobacillus fructosus]CAK1228705.1 4-hydroxy-tetrahydrodipicolinate reductase (DapB) [Fructobacillus fructosus]
MIKVIVAGFLGSMGQQAIQTITQQKSMTVVAVYSPHADQQATAYGLDESVQVYQQLSEIDVPADVWLDFTTPAAVFENTRFAIEHGIRPVIGTTGLSDAEEDELLSLSKAKGVAGLIVPNFSLSAVLLMKFSEEAAHYFSEVEVIEMHHEDKKDAPSGTAFMTAKRIDQVRRAHEQGASKETLPGARGADYHGIRIHAVRLPGYVAHEQVLFGGEGEALTIRQDSFSRSSFMKGVVLAIEKVGQLDQLCVGLEHVM